ncbi:MAG TPA: hypothetical protein VGK73_20240, partial [Polyangiaceae bacterium]
MVTFHVLTDIAGARLRVFRDRTERTAAELAYDAQPAGVDGNGLELHQTQLDHQIHEACHVRLHDEHWQHEEKPEHTKTLIRTVGYRFRKHYWIVQGTSRCVTRDPFESAQDRVRIHLVTAARYRGGRLYLWTPGTAGRFVDASGTTGEGPYFDVSTSGRERHLFLFKFVGAEGTYEPDYANRLWISADGAEVWVHSHATAVSAERPRLRALAVRLFDYGAPAAPLLHLWQEDSDFVTDLAGTREADGWIRFEPRLYSGRTYRFLFQNPALDPAWE